MILLVDIGNTRIKWAELSDLGLGEQSARAHAGLNREQIVEAMLGRTQRADRVLVANVGGPALGRMLREAIAQTWQIECEFIHSSRAAGGVRNAYDVPTNLGVDRWLAIIAAHERYGRAACVVSVGTAMTVDGVDAHGLHLGGVIVPGPDVMISSLLRTTSDIATRAATGSMRADLFADNTRGAIEQGAVHALAALTERAVSAIRERIAQDPALVLTGGASARIEALVATPHEVVPDLVLRGLAVIARENAAPAK